MQSAERPIEVTYFQRKPRAVANYSLEAIFEDVRARLDGATRARVSVARFESSGLLRRLYVVAEAFFRQGEVNHVTGDINFAGVLLRRRRTVQTILDCGTTMGATGLRRTLLRLLWLALPVRRCAVVTAISEATRQEILRLVPDCPPDKIKVVPVAISERFRPTPKAFEKTCPRILQVGTSPNKNVPRLVEALRGVECHLDLIGAHVPEYEAQLKASGVKYTYRWNLPAEQVLLAYQEADIVSFVSTHEGFGMPILEGQAVGRPVITSNVLSMPEVAGAGACLVDPLEVGEIRRGLLRIIEDDGYREELVRRGFENARRYDPDTIAQSYLAIYRQVAGR